MATMEIPIYQVDAFADAVFAGNPAAVCPLDRWIDDQLMQSIALENNLSETAFFVRQADGYDLRWFTPAAEVDLCGHATLASAWLIYNEIGSTEPALRFHTRSGVLTVVRNGSGLEMDFPATPPRECAPDDGLAAALGAKPAELLETDHHYVAIYGKEAEVTALTPDFTAVAALDKWAVIVSAPGDRFDFVTRMFAPRKAIPEDPVTGSAHCVLAPYWADRLGKQDLAARQVSSRGGNLACTVSGDRVKLGGEAKLFMRGTIFLDTDRT